MQQLAAFLARLISLYSFFIWIRIILSWVNPYPRPNSISWYFSRIVDPYLNLFRSRKFVVGYLNFSPLFAIGVLAVVQSLLNTYAILGTLTLGLILLSILQIFWSYAVQPFLMILIILLILRVIGSFTHSYGLTRMNGITENMVRKVQLLFFPQRLVKESTLAIIALVISILLYFAVRYVFVLLVNICWRIPF